MRLPSPLTMQSLDTPEEVVETAVGGRLILVSKCFAAALADPPVVGAAASRPQGPQDACGAAEDTRTNGTTTALDPSAVAA